MDSKNFHIKPGCKPFLLDGGEVGCVCLHGFTASPEEMRWLGEYLNQRGLTVYVPRLSGHGTDPAQLSRQHWLNWYENALDAVALLRARCRRVFVAGLSMGGLLSLRLAAAGQVDAAAVLAAPVVLDEPLMRFAWLIKYVRPMFGKSDAPSPLDQRVREIQRAAGRDDTGRGAYNVVPTPAAAQLYALMGDVHRHLSDITAPLLLVYSRGDQTVPYRNLALVAGQVRSTDLVTHTLIRSDHCLTQEIERETVYAQVWEFLSARMAGG